MNKRELIKNVSEKTNIKQSISKRVVDETINLIKECFYLGIIINLKSFGKFEYKEIKERKRYIPSLQCVKYEKQKIVPKFKPSKSFYGKLL